MKKPPLLLKKAPKLKNKTEPFFVHLQELRRRVSIYVTTVVVAAILGYFLRDKLTSLVVAPLHHQLFYTSPAGGFNFLLQLCIAFGFVITIPVLIYELVEFVLPAFPEITKKVVMIVVTSSLGLVTLGITFSYFVAVPVALSFLDRFGGGDIQALITSDAYFSFVLRYLFGFALFFQFPLVFLLINQIRRFQVSQLMAFERWVILGCTVLAAIITPTPDVFNLALMAVPPILLYQGTVLLIFLINRRMA